MRVVNFFPLFISPIPHSTNTLTRNNCREKNEDGGAIEEEGGKAPEEEEECPFVTDKYIMPEQWTGFTRTWITKVSLPARILALSEGERRAKRAVLELE